MTPQPIQTRSSAESSPIITPSGTPPLFLSQGFEGRLHHFFSALDGAGGPSKGVQADGDGVRRKSDAGIAGPSRAPSFTYAARPALPFFSNLSLSRPQTATPYNPQPSYGVGMAKTLSAGGSSDASSSLGRPDTKRAATLPTDATALAALEKRHYDPSREPKLLHFM